MKKIFVAILATWALTGVFQTQGQSALDSTSADSSNIDRKIIELHGSLDTYLRQNISGPNGSKAIAPNTSFANLNGFALGMANLVTSVEHKKVGFVADLVFGPRGEDAVFLSSALRPGGSSNIVNQLFAYWNVTDRFTLTMGNFNTFLGYEVISPVGNFHYSTSYMFSYGPFSHSGIKADMALSENWSVMLAFLNNTDATEFNPNNSFTTGFQLGYKSTFLNVLYGKQGTSVDPTFQIDLTGGYQLLPIFYLGLNSTYNTTGAVSFYGVALYPKFSIGSALEVGVRGEYFSEINGGAGAIGQYNLKGDAHIFATTFTASYSIGDFCIKPEIRIDNSSEKTFLDDQLNPDNNLSSFLLAVVYSF